MRRIGSQRKYECFIADFPISIQIEAGGMEVFQGVLSDAEVVDPATGEGIATYKMPLALDALIATSSVRSPNTPPEYDPEADIFITFGGAFATAQAEASPQYTITLTAASGDVEVTRTRRPAGGRDAVARLIFLYRESE
jgi:hypothetical protein